MDPANKVVSQSYTISNFNILSPSPPGHDACPQTFDYFGRGAKFIISKWLYDPQSSLQADGTCVSISSKVLHDKTLTVAS